MKKLLSVAGIVLLVLCCLSFLAAALYLMGYRSALDGSPAFYERMHRRMLLFAAIGAVLAVGGVGCLVLYFKR